MCPSRTFRKPGTPGGCLRPRSGWTHRSLGSQVTIDCWAPCRRRILRFPFQDRSGERRLVCVAGFSAFAPFAEAAKVSEEVPEASPGVLFTSLLSDRATASVVGHCGLQEPRWVGGSRISRSLLFGGFRAHDARDACSQPDGTYYDRDGREPNRSIRHVSHFLCTRGLQSGWLLHTGPLTRRRP